MLMVQLIFFFKQKTAYELSLGDWSSDVCSSDLIGSLAGVAGTTVTLGANTLTTGGNEIGRASCRERGL